MSTISSDEEDFSFPKMTDESHPCGLDSPPLWSLSPANRSDEVDCVARKIGKNDERKSFSYVEKLGWNLISKDDKMDLLWEDFNEDLTRSQSLKLDPNSTNGSSLSDAVNLGCGARRSLRLSKLEKKKPNLFVFIKALKRFLIRRRDSSQRSSAKSHARGF